MICQTTKKKKLIKRLQHFGLIVKFYTSVIPTQNVVKFWRHILPYLSVAMNDIYTKKNSVLVRRCHLQAKPRKQNSLKVYFALFPKTYFALLFLSIAMTDVYQIGIAFSDYFEITTAVVVRCGGREMSSRTLTECCYFYWGQTSDIRKSLKPKLGAWRMLHFPVCLMNRLNQTESAVYNLCRFTLFPKYPLPVY